jgi:HptB-dependent secretion and biofilm anti anti-sigma factor
VKYEINDSAGRTVLHVSGDMTVSDRGEFDVLLSRVFNSGNRNVLVDMKGLDYMDSAGLGMLLMIHKKAEEQGAKVTIKNPEGEVKEMLDLARFDILFAIEHGR